MTAVLGPGVDFSRVALETDAIAGNSLLAAVRVVAIAARHACSKHPALLERNIVIGLGDVPHLAVGPVDISRKRGSNRVRVLKPVPGHPILGHLAATRMAATAGFNFCPQKICREIATNDSAGGIVRPYDAFSLI